jgi:hypothetical protein
MNTELTKYNHLQIVFDKIHKLFEKHFGKKLDIQIDESENYKETHLSIKDSEIWISCDDRELTIGSGFNHRHYNVEYDDINMGINELFNLLTQRKRNTKYFKGNSCYKVKTEIETQDLNFNLLSTSSTWAFAFWKPTIEKVMYDEKQIEEIEIRTEMNEIKHYAQQWL